MFFGVTEAKSNYDIAIKDLVYRPGFPLELVTVETTKKMGSFYNISRDVRKKFKTND
jgi:phytoene desaturase